MKRLILIVNRARKGVGEKILGKALTQEPFINIVSVRSHK